MRYLLIISFLNIWYSAEGQVAPELAAQLQNILDDRVMFDGDHGVSATVIMPNGSMWSGQAGLNGEGIPIHDSTVFHAASAMKTHTTVLVMLLAEEGLIDLDTSWDNYIDLDVSFDPDITIRQLLSNTSGIADYLEIPATENFVLSDPDHFFTAQEILEDVVNQDPDFSPGSDFHYSTTNFALAALIVESITGNPVEVELRNRIWIPLGLEHTYFGAYEAYSEDRAGVWWNFGNGLQSYNDISETSMLSYGYGGANLVSTPHDNAIFIHALFNNEILSPVSLEQMLEFSPQSYDDWSAGYGMGLHHAINTGTDEVLGVDGYYTNMSSSFWSSDYQFSAVTMTNTMTDWYGIYLPIYNTVKTWIETGIAMPDIDHIEIFPNPSSGEINITWDGNFSQLNVRNGTGQEIMQFNIASKSVLKIDNFSPGIYFIEMSGGKNKVVRKLIVV